jgi:hypothetical protein
MLSICTRAHVYPAIRVLTAAQVSELTRQVAAKVGIVYVCCLQKELANIFVSF